MEVRVTMDEKENVSVISKDAKAMAEIIFALRSAEHIMLHTAGMLPVPVSAAPATPKTFSAAVPPVAAEAKV